jgi:hypothetical protein
MRQIRNWKILLSIAILALGFVAFLGYVSRESDPDRLFAALIKQMQKGNYEDIYENSSDLLQLNVNKAEFTQRMSEALRKIKQVDGELNFRRDKEEETSIFTIQRNSDKAIGRSSPNTQNFVIERLGNGGNEIMVMVFWDEKGLFPKFGDLTILPINNERQDLRVKGIVYKK